jgi:O-antigen ligase
MMLIQMSTTTENSRVSTLNQSSYSFRFANWSIAGLALSLAVSKAGISLFSALLLVAFIGVWASNREQFRWSQLTTVSRSLLALFCLGVVCSLLSYGGGASAKDFANKGSLLLVLPMGLMFLQYRVVRATALTALLLGAVVACSYSFYLWLQVSADGGGVRIASFWDLGRWGEYLCYFLMLLTPLLFSGDQPKRSRGLFIACYIVAFVILLTSGVRGPLLTVTLATASYMILYNRRLLVPFLLLLTVLIGLVYVLAPNIIEFAVVRFRSIFDFTNLSNLARINMWSYALDFFQYNLTHDMRSVLFGSGFENLAATFEPFLDETNQRAVLMEVSGGEASYHDHHNAFLNVLNKMGVVYLIGWIVTGYYVVRSLLSKVRLAPTNPWYQSAFFVLLSYLMVGIFYSNELNYQTLMATFMCALAVRHGDAKLRENQSHV